MNGRARIEAERQKQKDVYGWTAEHDAQHVNGELAKVAELYSNLHVSPVQTFAWWPETWDRNWMRRKGYPFPLDRDLEKAGALYLAEIDRRRNSGIEQVFALTNHELEMRVSAIAAELDRRAAGGQLTPSKDDPLAQRLDPPRAKRYLGVMVMAAVPRASGCVPGYDVRYPNGCIDWSPAAVFDKHCFELGETDEVTEDLAGRFYSCIGGALDLEDASTSMLATLVSWGKFGHAELTAPVTNGLRCSLHCPFLTEDSDCAKHRDPKGHYCECEVDEAAETGEVGPLRCPLCLELHPVETPAAVPADEDCECNEGHGPCGACASCRPDLYVRVGGVSKLRAVPLGAVPADLLIHNPEER